MKKIVSLILVLVMVCSLGIAVCAADEYVDYRTGTDVTYNPADPDGIPESGDEVDLEAYTVTVPATMLPGTEATVTATGAWATNRKLVVTADTSVVLGNDIDDTTKELDVTFDGINATGNNEVEQTFTATVAVEEIENALFGVWSGHFSYEAGIVDAE